MNEAKHTRAPWRISDENPKIIKQDFSMIGSNHEAIVACACGYDNTVLYPSDEQAIANAPLIAAAPELLEACKSLLTLTQLMANESYDDEAVVEFEIFSEKTKSTRCLVLVFELAKARAAIAKATGRADSGQAAH